MSANPGVITKFVAAEKANLAFLRSNPQQTMAAIQQYNSTSSTTDDKIAYSFFLHVWKQNPTVYPGADPGGIHPGRHERARDRPVKRQPVHLQSAGVRLMAPAMSSYPRRSGLLGRRRRPARSAGA